MFVLSVKSEKLKKFCAFALVAVLATIGGVYYVNISSDKLVSSMNGLSLKAVTNEERIAFFYQFGWQVKEEPAEVKEVVIPTEFDETYTQYNELQKKQNMDLSKYKGIRVKMWAYEITNYPGYEDNSSVIHGNMLVYDGVVIGGDVSSTELGGFMETFEKTI